MRLRTDRALVGFAGADADDIIERHGKDFAVANAAGRTGAGAVDDGFGGVFNKGVANCDFQLELWQQPLLNFLGPVHLRHVTLAVEASDFADGREIDITLGKRDADVLKCLRTDDGKGELVSGEEGLGDGWGGFR